MAPTVLTPTKPESPTRIGDFSPTGGGFGEEGFGGGGGGEGREWHVPIRTYRTGVLVGLAGIVMLFAAFTSALVVRRGISTDGVTTALPRILYLNTLVLVISSGTLELSRRSLAAGESGQFQRWLDATVVLGLAFVGGQLAAWRELTSRGVYLATNPSSSFFYVLTGTHGLHLLGGLMALLYLVFQARSIPYSAKKRAAVDVAALYWHFMDGLWIYILLLLMTRS